jgi:hypothetical protein
VLSICSGSVKTKPVRTEPPALPIRCRKRLPDGQRCGRTLGAWSDEFPVFQLDRSRLGHAILAPDPMRNAAVEGSTALRYEADCPHCGAHAVWTDRMASAAAARGEPAIWV